MMRLNDHLAPKQVVDLLADRVRRRISILEGTRLPEYLIVLHELRLVHDLLLRASKYIERGKDKRS